MKKQAVLTLTLALLSAPLVFGEWTLVDDFEDGVFDGWIFTDHIKVGEELPPDAIREIITDPFGTPGNQVFLYRAGPPNVFGNIRSGSNVALPEPITPGPIGSPKTITFYLRFLATDTSLDFNFGLSDVAQVQPDPPTELGAPLPFNSFEYQMRVSLADFLIPTVRFASSFESAVGTPALSPGTWYEAWFVIDLAEVDSIWRLYLKGGAEYPTQTQIAVEIEVGGSFFTVNNFLSRNNDDQPLETVLIAANAGTEDQGVIGGTAPMFFDDLYIDATGENLETPTAGPTEPETIPVQTARMMIDDVDSIVLTFPTENGVTYSIKAASSLEDGDFVEVEQIVGDGNPATFTDDVSLDRRFYIVESL